MTLSPKQMRDLMATLLTGAAGNSHEHWLEAVGPVKKLPTHSNVRCNWRISPKGSKRDLEAIEKAVEIVREEHPYVAG
jgi:4-aminobutyrate aminotransferase-like enzyme